MSQPKRGGILHRLSVVVESDLVPDTVSNDTEMTRCDVTAASPHLRCWEPGGVGAARVSPVGTAGGSCGPPPSPARAMPPPGLASLGQVTDQQTAETPRGELPGNCHNEDDCLQKQAARFSPHLFMQHQPPAVEVHTPLLLARLLFWSRTQERTNLKVPRSSSLSASSFISREKEDKPQRAVQTGEMLSTAAPLPVLCAGEYGLSRYRTKSQHLFQ